MEPTRVNYLYLTNILLKINGKLGSLNSMLTTEHGLSIPVISKAPTMMLGMDVPHGSPCQADVPSISKVGAWTQGGSDCFHVVNPAAVHNLGITRFGVNDIEDDVDGSWSCSNRNLTWLVSQSSKEIPSRQSSKEIPSQASDSLRDAISRNQPDCDITQHSDCFLHLDLLELVNVTIDLGDHILQGYRFVEEEVLFGLAVELERIELVECIYGVLRVRVEPSECFLLQTSGEKIAEDVVENGVQHQRITVLLNVLLQKNGRSLAADRNLLLEELAEYFTEPLGQSALLSFGLHII
ncbi:hypothetical protein GIB67_024044 [Kingdonia uniflora]|uniref:Piwi domain-containing protein n=1 Tax=Kingdonia uniflora TaxID=39325 RepID=A0A7J7LAU3_9MAGN|nr:hypothetical protein GIB67_024044 [Kingdonia uniflora]